jgi:glyoxylase-like metal-dependent hydrolase (beta-lactamase superfamily II)
MVRAARWPRTRSSPFHLIAESSMTLHPPPTRRAFLQTAAAAATLPLCACASAPAAAEGTSIRVYTSSVGGFFVNSLIVETRDSVLLIDAQMIEPEARQVKALIDAAGKPLAGVVITHPHLDHFGGLPAILEGRRAVPVFATPATRDEMVSRVQALRQGGKSFPDEALPNTLIRSGELLDVRGARVRVEDLGAGEAVDVTIAHFPDHHALLASDLIYHHAHAWLLEGRTGAWLKQLDDVKARYATVVAVYPGHGPAGDLRTLDAQREYIEFNRRLVGDHLKSGGALDDAARARLKGEIERRYPGRPLDGLIDGNIKGIARELGA